MCVVYVSMWVLRVSFCAYGNCVMRVSRFYVFFRGV